LEQIEAAKADPEKAPLNEKEKALLVFVLKATKDPHSVDAGQIAALKKLGWAERDIFDALAHGARAVATNIIFDAFKVEQDFC
jgi:alkylhydroperoxidase family enzyme